MCNVLIFRLPQIPYNSMQVPWKQELWENSLLNRIRLFLKL